MSFGQNNVPIILDEYGKVPYISYLQLGYADSPYSMYTDSYMVRFFGMPSYYMPGTQKTYELAPDIAGTIQTTIKKKRSRDNNIALQNPALNAKSQYRGSLLVDISLTSEVNDDRIESYELRRLNGNVLYANGMTPMNFEQEIFFAMKRQTAIMLDQFLFQTLIGSMPTGTNANGIYNENDFYEYTILKPNGLELQPLPISQYIAIDEDYMTLAKDKTDYELAGSQIGGQGLTLSKLLAAASAFANNNIEGQLVCFIPKSCKNQLMRHPRAGDRTKEYVDQMGATETDSAGNTFKRPFAWMSQDILMLDNIMLVFVPDERFPKTNAQKKYHITTIGATNLYTADGKPVDEKDTPDEYGYIKHAYMVKVSAGTGTYSNLEHPTVEWGLYDRDVFVSQALSKVIDAGANMALERLGTTNGFVVHCDRYNDSMMKMLRYSINTQLQLARIVDKNVIAIEIHPNQYGNALN